MYVEANLIEILTNDIETLRAKTLNKALAARQELEREIKMVNDLLTRTRTELDELEDRRDQLSRDIQALEEEVYT